MQLNGSVDGEASYLFKRRRPPGNFEVAQRSPDDYHGGNSSCAIVWEYPFSALGGGAIKGRKGERGGEPIAGCNVLATRRRRPGAFVATTKGLRYMTEWSGKGK